MGAHRPRWQNIPLPEPHLASAAAAFLLSRARPWPLPQRRLIAPLGWAALLSGCGLVAWSVQSAQMVRLDQPDRLVSAGAYGLSRHPMYVGWTLAYLGAGAVSANAWAVALSPGLVLLVEREVRREEQHLDEQFGLDYSAYRRRVPRYLPLPHRRS